MKHREVIEKILAYHPHISDYEGCDGYKSGDPDDECTGIVSALVPTVEVIQKAHDLGCNLIITHEPIYYQTPDFPDWKGCFCNTVQTEKEDLIRRYGITIWRDHDHIHAHRPDGIFSGVIEYLGWMSYYRPDLVDEGVFMMPFEIPKTTVKELGKYLMDKIGMKGLRFIGNPDDAITRVALTVHLYPHAFGPDEIGEDGFYRDYSMTVMEQMEKYDIQAIIPGEIIEWTVLSYIRDAISMGKVKACFNIGHFSLEELGMKQVACWLAELTEHRIPVHYVPTGDIYHYL